MAKKALPFSDENLEDFLAALLLTGSVSEACTKIQVTEPQIAKWKDEPLYKQLVDAIKEAERTIKLGVSTDAAFEAAGFPSERFERMLRLKDFRAGLRVVEAQREVEATKVLRAVAGPRPKTITETKKTVKPNGDVETVIKNVTSETGNAHAANKLLTHAQERLVSTDLTGEKPEDGLVKQPHGGAIQNGKGRGRPPGRKATITTALEILNEAMSDDNPESMLRYVMRGMAREAHHGNARMAELLLVLLEKGDAGPGGLGGKSDTPTTVDPLFDRMPDQELDMYVKRILMTEMNDVIEAEYEESEVDESEEVAIDA